MKLFKELKWDALLMGVLYVLLGIVALVMPETMEQTLGYMLGVVLIIGGAVSMICYLLRDAYQNYYHNDFFHGLLIILAGIFVLNKSEYIISIIPFLLGLLVLISGCSKLQDVIDMKRMQCGNWIVMLIVATVNVLLGVFLLWNPFETATLLFKILGIGLVLCGLTDCVNTFYFAGKIRKYKKQQDEAQAQKVSESSETVDSADEKADIKVSEEKEKDTADKDKSDKNNVEKNDSNQKESDQKEQNQADSE